jgi:hypothetical protein
MLSNNRIQNLKTAASAFVSTVMSSDNDQRISIGIVPFNGQVNLGSTLLSQYNVAHPHGTADVNCVDLPASVYTSTDLSDYAYDFLNPTPALPMTAYADTYSSTSQSTSYVAWNGSSANLNVLNEWCPPRPGNIIRLPQQDVPTLQGYINGLDAIGATSINAGMKWGLALLDPSSRAMYSNLIAGGHIPAGLEGRPFNYDDNEAMKVVVLMTDGSHFKEDRVNDTYKSGPSGIWKSNSDGYYSVYHASAAAPNQYYVPHLGTWRSVPWSNSTNTGTATEQTWPQIWANMRLSYVAWQFYARPLGGSSSSLRSATYNTWMGNFREQTEISDMDTQLQSVCTLAKDEGVIVYGIAFEAPTEGQTQIRACSSSPAHYFNAQGLQISTAFTAIANNISQLRLTQ